VFERGFTTKRVGTGTGLATVYEAVQELGGRICFHSELGRGTEFEIDLPAALDLDSPHSVAEGDQPTARILSDDTTVLPVLTRPTPARVLLVEDDDAVRSYVSHVLEGAGLRVVSTGEPGTALHALPGSAIDLLVTDVTLPGMTGWELAEQVRAAYPRVGVIFISGESAKEVLGPSGSEFLQKPFTPLELMELVRRLLRQPV
jgi:two-component system cell cycle sensor histidine kinase/response regulator CckA